MWGCSDADILKTGYHIDTVGHIDGTRAETAREEVIGVDTEEGNGLKVTDGEHTSVLQQYHALGARLAGNLSMCFQIGLVAELIAAETWGLDDILEHAAHVTIDILDVEFAVLHAIDDVFYLRGKARGEQIVACFYLIDGVESLPLSFVNPVSHYYATEPPVGTENICKQVLAALCMNTIDNVVS